MDGIQKFKRIWGNIDLFCVFWKKKVETKNDLSKIICKRMENEKKPMKIKPIETEYSKMKRFMTQN